MQATAAARRLAAHGVRRGATVTLELPVGVDYVVLLHGLMKLGRFAQPLNTRLAPAERQAELGRARAGAHRLPGGATRAGPRPTCRCSASTISTPSTAV